MLSSFRVSTFILLYLTASWCRAAENGDALTTALRHYSEAIRVRDAGDTTAALVSFKASIASCDTLYQVRLSYGDLLLRRGDNEAAERELRQVLALRPGHYNTATLLSALYYKTARYDSALVMYELMDTLKPGDTAVLTGIAGLSEYLGKNDLALETYRRLIDAGDRSSETLLKAARLALKTGANQNALEYARRALEQRSEDGGALDVAAQASENMELPKDALGYLKRLSVVDSTSREPVMRMEGISRTLGDPESLLDALERHHRLDPADTGVLAELAGTLYTLNRLDDAVGYVRQGIDREPANGRFRVLMGEYHRLRGDRERALEQYRLALPDSAWREDARVLINSLEKPESNAEKQEREFFERAR